MHAGSGIDIMLQNAPAPMGIGLSLEKVAELARAVEGIRYVKEEAPPSGQRITQLTELAGDSLLAVFGGAGARYVIDELTRGAKGTMPACEISELHVAMFDRFRRGDEAGARDLFERTLPLLNMQAIFRWRLTKEVLQRRGLIESTFVRAPGPELDRYDRLELDALLARLARSAAARGRWNVSRVASVETFIVTIPRDTPYLGPLAPGETRQCARLRRAQRQRHDLSDRRSFDRRAGDRPTTALSAGARPTASAHRARPARSSTTCSRR